MTHSQQLPVEESEVPSPAGRTYLGCGGRGVLRGSGFHAGPSRPRPRGLALSLELCPLIRSPDSAFCPAPSEAPPHPLTGCAPPLTDRPRPLRAPRPAPCSLTPFSWARNAPLASQGLSLDTGRGPTGPWERHLPGGVVALGKVGWRGGRQAVLFLLAQETWQSQGKALGRACRAGGSSGPSFTSSGHFHRQDEPKPQGPSPLPLFPNL